METELKPGAGVQAGVPTSGAPSAGGAPSSGGAPLADGSDPSKPIPYARFKEVNDRAKDAETRRIEAETKRQEAEARASQYETYLASPQVQEALRAAASPKPQSGVPISNEPYDPYNPESIARLIRQELSSAFEREVKPVKELVQRNVFDQQIREAQAAFRGKPGADWTKDQPAIFQQLRETPGLTATEAWILVQAKRQGLEAGGYSSHGVEVGSGNGAPRNFEPEPDQLTSEELVAAQRFGLTPEQYLEGKKQSQSIRDGKIPAASAGV